MYYRLGEKDKKLLAQRLASAVKILVAAIASQVRIGHLVFSVSQDDPDQVLESAEFHDYINHVIQLDPSASVYRMSSSEQMGSCRMGLDPKNCVVGLDGESWNIKGLYLADASLFPTASGVNPTSTVYSLAYTTAQRILKDIHTIRFGSHL